MAENRVEGYVEVLDRQQYALTFSDSLPATETISEAGAVMCLDGDAQALKPLRTLHVETGMHLSEGPSQVIYLMLGLRSRGHEAALVCPRGSAISVEAAKAGLDVVTLPLHSDLDLSFIPRLARILRSRDVDVVHLHSRRGADIMGGLAARIARVPAVVLSRRVGNPVGWGTLARLKFGPFCDRIIAVSNGVADTLIDGGVDPEKITCVYGVAGQSSQSDSGPGLSLRREFGLDKDTNIIVIMAQLIERSGHSFLFHAVERILERHPRTAVVVIGEGRLENSLKSLAESLGISDRVIFAGYRGDVGSLLSEATLMVHPATVEGFADCVIQASAAGIPVVASAVGGILEAIEDGNNGILVPAGDADAIGHAVVRLLDSPDLRQTMGAAGRRIVEERFGIDGMVDEVIQVYRSALGTGTPISGETEVQELK